jgi:A/G-specific adenine glycosylase
VVTGLPYYERFLERFPTVRDLARASPRDVLRVWEGLGFYRRAQNLHAAAKAIVERHGGEVPRDVAMLEALPGIGPYTAGAIGSIAFGIRAPAIDGNATRVLSRLFRISDGASAHGKRGLLETATALVPEARPGEFNQALMELGATVCTPTSPDCPACPLEHICLARAEGIQGDLPPKQPLRRPRVVPVVFGLVERGDRLLLIRRPERGLLGGLWALPGGERGIGVEDRTALREAIRAQAGIRARVGPRLRRVDQTFSHRTWTGSIYRCTVDRRSEDSDFVLWVTREEALRLPLIPSHRAAIEDASRVPGPRGT